MRTPGDRSTLSPEKEKRKRVKRKEYIKKVSKENSSSRSILIQTYIQNDHKNDLRRKTMSVITFVCAGQMNSAITFPAFENGHEVRLVGSPLDRDIIDGLRKDNFHITLKRTLHDGIKYYQIEELQEALEGADLILGGVSSFRSEEHTSELQSR